MGLISIAPVQRFMDGSDSDHIYAGTRLLVSEFLRAIQAKNIHFKYGMHPQMRELMISGAFGAAGSQKFGAGGRLLESIGEDREIWSDPRVVVESTEVAVETCATRMSKLSTIPGVSRGISFGIDREPDGPKSSWAVVLHRGPLPLLRVELADINGFNPPKKWSETIIGCDCAHIIEEKRGRCFGRGDHIYLLLKRQELFPYSKGKVTEETVAAGQHLRKWCEEIWRGQQGRTDLYELPSWQWKRKRFIRSFDEKLVAHVGSESLEQTIRRMGTSPVAWFQTPS